MTRRHRLPLPAHEFIPGDVPDWNGEHRWCARSGCGLPRESRIHTEYKPVNGDRSDAILGEHDDAA